MSINTNQILNEARTLVTRLQERDKMSDTLIRHAQTVTEKINCLKEYKDDLNDLHEMRIAQRPRSVLVHNLQQENRQIKILQEENRQLKMALEEHQATLDMIMQRYRQQVVEMIKLNKLQQMTGDAMENVHRNNVSEESTTLVRFALLFDQCLKGGEDASTKDQEELSRLKTENQTLRQLLKIAVRNDPSTLTTPTKETATFDESALSSRCDDSTNAQTKNVAEDVTKNVDETYPKVQLAAVERQTAATLVKEPVSNDTTIVKKVAADSAVSTTILAENNNPTLKVDSSKQPNNGNNNNNANAVIGTASASINSSKSTKTANVVVASTTKRGSIPQVNSTTTPATSNVKKSTSQDSALMNGNVCATPKKTSIFSKATTIGKGKATSVEIKPAANVVQKQTVKMAANSSKQHVNATIKTGSSR